VAIRTTDSLEQALEVSTEIHSSRIMTKDGAGIASGFEQKICHVPENLSVVILQKQHIKKRQLVISCRSGVIMK